MPHPALAVLLALPLLQDPAGFWTDVDDARLVEVRREIEALRHVQGVLSWYSRTVGEESLLAETYVGHERLFAPETVRWLAKAENRQGISADERRALRFLRGEIAIGYIDLGTAEIADRIQNEEANATVRLSWRGDEEVSYQNLPVLSLEEKDSDRRAEIGEVQAAIWRDLLNPLYAEMLRVAHERARSCGYSSYVSLSEAWRFVDLATFAPQCDRFLRETEDLYRGLLEEAAATIEKTPETLRRSDIPALMNPEAFTRFFPKEVHVPLFRFFLEGIGLDLTTAAATEIVIDDARHPKKNPRAACFSIRAPRDIRVTVKPTDGLADLGTFFHEGGHALHFANATTPIVEFRESGNFTTTEGYAEFFQYLWDEPSWYARYAKFLARWNAEHADAPVPVPTDEDVRRIVRHRVFAHLYFMRRYSAKVLYECIYHGADPATWKGAYEGPAADPQAAYGSILSRAYGFPLTESDTLRYRTDVDAYFYAADYLRAFWMGHQMHEALRHTDGEKWFEKPEIGLRLKKLWREGTKLQGDEALREIGFTQAYDVGVVRNRLTRLLARE